LSKNVVAITYFSSQNLYKVQKQNSIALRKSGLDDAGKALIKTFVLTIENEFDSYHSKMTVKHYEVERQDFEGVRRFQKDLRDSSKG